MNFNLKLSNLNNITGERTKGILYYELTVKDLELKRLQGFAAPILSSFEQSVINDREAILILISKLHEYVASLKLELATNLADLDNYHKFKVRWNNKKLLIEKQIEELS